MRKFTCSLFAAAALLMGFGATHAQAPSWPTHTVRIVVPFAAGGPADNYARFIALRLQEALGQSFVVHNKPGGGSVLGTYIVAKSPAVG
ncbi:MAG: tripartite tricarboxylate transporter substrate binding protein, partial [Ramlibacter sp.]|nr:tripartite tricarboxylate transporter substrate binding protein [Ramlibacter sp.]